MRTTEMGKCAPPIGTTPGMRRPVRTITWPPISSRRMRFGLPTPPAPSGVIVAALRPSPCSRTARAASCTTSFFVARRDSSERSKRGRSRSTPITSGASTRRASSSSSWPVSSPSSTTIIRVSIAAECSGGAPSFVTVCGGPMRRRSLLLLLAPLALVVFLAVFLGPRLFEEDAAGEDEYRRLAEEAVNPGRVEVWGAWDGVEQEAFEAVLDGYMEAFPGTDVVYVPLGDELEERIREAAAEQTLPDLAILSGTRLPQELAEQGLLLPLHRIEQDADEPFGESFVPVGGFGDEEPLGVMVKPRNESLVWYSTAAYEEARVEPSGDWEELLGNAGALTAAGVPAYSVPGAEGAALMDVFEVLFL